VFTECFSVIGVLAQREEAVEEYTETELIKAGTFDPATFRIQLDTLVASKLGVASYEPMSPSEMDRAIASKDAQSFALMKEYFQKTEQCVTSVDPMSREARAQAASNLISRLAAIAG
jgi:hypothetical protein